MKVRHVVRQFAPALGGLESVVLNLSTHQRALGCDASVVTLDRVFNPWSPRLPEADTVAGVPVIRLPFAGPRRYPLAPTVLAHLGDADIVHVHWTDFFFEFLAWTKALHRKRLVATTHGGFFHTERSARIKRLYFATMTRAASLSYDRIVACSEADAERFSKIARRRTVTIENGVAFPQFAGKGSPVLTRTIAYFGRLSSNKRIATLFPLLRELRCLSPEWRLIIAGGDFDITA